MKKEYDFSKAKIGAISPALKGKTKITIRLDTNVVDWFREQVDVSGGGNYQTMINNVLKSYISEKENQKGKEELLESMPNFLKLVDKLNELYQLNKILWVTQGHYKEVFTFNKMVFNDFEWNIENEESTYPLEKKSNIPEMVVYDA